VIKLDGRAGSPPTALGLLERHGGEDGLIQINMLLREWETWGSELLESHLSYPMLAYYRSQHHDQSWLGALAAIMDCCALILAGLESVPPLQARMTFIMARQILVEMAQSFGVRPSRYTGGDRLDHPAFLQLQRGLVEAAAFGAFGNALCACAGIATPHTSTLAVRAVSNPRTRSGSLNIVTGRWPDVAVGRGWIAGKCLFGKAVSRR